MRDESQALSTIPAPVPEETDYDAICAAVMQTERGRWFLQEYARRNRNADTQLVLAAVERLETVIRTEHARASHAGLQSDLVAIAKAFALPGPEPEEISAEPQPTSNGGPTPSDGQPGIFETATRLQGLALTMRERGLDPATGTQIDALAAAILSAPSMRDPGDPRAEKLAAVLAQLERRIEAMLVDAASPTGAVAEPPDGTTAEVSPSTAVSPAPATLDGPALTPLSSAPPAEAAGRATPVPAEPVPSASAGDAAQIDDELFATLPVPGETRPAPIISAQPASSTPPQPATASRLASTGRVVAASGGVTTGDPLAALKAMSDDERIALFT